MTEDKEFSTRDGGGVRVMINDDGKAVRIYFGDYSGGYGYVSLRGVDKVTVEEYDDVTNKVTFWIDGEIVTSIKSTDSHALACAAVSGSDKDLETRTYD